MLCEEGSKKALYASEETPGECLLDGLVSKSPSTNEKAHDELPGDNLLAQGQFDLIVSQVS